MTAAAATTPTITRPPRKSRAAKRVMLVGLAIFWAVGCVVALGIAFSATRASCTCSGCSGTAP